MNIIKNIKILKKFIDSSADGNDLVDGYLKYDNEKIVELGLGEIDDGIDGQGFVLLPGLIDPQVHFREPGGEHKETLESGSRAAVKGGFTSVITMPNTSPTTDNSLVLEKIIEKSNQIGLCRILPTAAVTKGLKGLELTDFKELKNAGMVALTDDGRGIQSDELMEEAFYKAKELNLAILDHAEDDDLSQGGAITQSILSKDMGIIGQDPDSEWKHVKRGCELSEKTGCHYHVLHISTKKAIEEVIKAKKKGLKVSAEASPHHLLLSVEDIKQTKNGIDTNFKMNPPLRLLEDKEFLNKALLDGYIDFIATDHAPHSEDEKSRPINEAPFGIVGVETAFSLIYTNFVKSGKIDLYRLVELMSLNPSKVFNLGLDGLNRESSADFILVDLKNKFQVKKEEFVSKGKNSPFIGEELFGKVVKTFYKGKVVYEC